MPKSPSASTIARRCFAVFAFLLTPRPPRGPFFGPAVSPVLTGVAAPDGLADASSKWPSPVHTKLATVTTTFRDARRSYLHDTYHPDSSPPFASSPRRRRRQP